MENLLSVVVSLRVIAGARTQFEAYEATVIPIMSEYGGRLISAVAIDPVLSPDAEFNEIHVLQFPSMVKFDAYRSDPRIAGLAADRERCIAMTAILFGAPYIYAAAF